MTNLSSYFIFLDVDSAVFKVLMEFMYTGQLSVTTTEKISLYHASVILEMESAQELLQQAYISNVWPGIMNAKVTKDSDPSVKDIIETGVKDNSEEIHAETTGKETSNETSLPKPRKKGGRKKKGTMTDLKGESEERQELGVGTEGEGVVQGRRMVTRNRGKRRPTMFSPKNRKIGKKESKEIKKEAVERKKESVVQPVRKVTKVWVPGSASVRCESCGKLVKSYSALKRHMVLRHKQFSTTYSHSRAIVSNVIKSAGAMRYCSRVDSPKKFTCTLCGSSFRFYSLFYRHAQETHMQLSRGDKQGEYCRVVKHIQNLKSILNRKKDRKGTSPAKRARRTMCNKTYEKCCYCHAVLSKGRIYASHLIKKHYLSFEKAKELTGYPKYQLPQKWECPECNLTFVGNKALKSHFEAVHQLDDVKYPCPECDSSYSCLGTIKSHLRWVHKKTVAEVKEALKDSVTCEVKGCDYTTGNMMTLKLHMVKVHPEVEYKCTECNFTFHVKKTLNRHMIVKHLRRSELQKKQCEACGRRFNRNAQLHVHQFSKHNIYHEHMKVQLKGIQVFLLYFTFINSQKSNYGSYSNSLCLSAWQILHNNNNF